MFEVIGYLITIFLISLVVTVLVEYTKKFNLIKTLYSFFIEKVKIINFYQLESILISLLLLIILNLLEAINISLLALILNSIIIGLLSNGIFTYDVVKILLEKLKLRIKL